MMGYPPNYAPLNTNRRGQHSSGLRMEDANPVWVIAIELISSLNDDLLS